MKKNSIITSILLLLMAVAIFTVSVMRDNVKKDETKDTLNQIQAIVSPYQNKDTMKRVDIITDFTNSSKEHKPTTEAKKGLIVSGLIKEGYLYVKASVDEGKPLTQYDDVYAMLQSGGTVFLGGHLIKNQSLDTPETSTSTEFLYKLSDVKYKKSFNSSNLEIQSGNWLQVLNSAGDKKILGFSSTARVGVLEDVIIYYECIEGQDCSIIVQ